VRQDSGIVLAMDGDRKIPIAAINAVLSSTASFRVCASRCNSSGVLLKRNIGSTGTATRLGPIVYRVYSWVCEVPTSRPVVLPFTPTTARNESAIATHNDNPSIPCPTTPLGCSLSASQEPYAQAAQMIETSRSGTAMLYTNFHKETP
jgi:hypothetical protein